jgi:hypothetical protein
VRLYGGEQRFDLEYVAGRVHTGLFRNPALVDRFLDGCDDQFDAKFIDRLVPEVEDLLEIVSGIDVHDGERQPCWIEGLDREAQHERRVLPSGKQQNWAFGLRGRFANDED